ncbi:MAG: ABC transporter ATP-binding protein [Bifidobacteriaceae bacterium]|jgi:putative ABC transport system ATP-binding protein|nr:ABC transporter ATP-binding protein [Bifidobacteriaceae bacterium]
MDSKTIIQGNLNAKKVTVRTANLSKTYGSGSTKVKAVDNVSLEIYEGELTEIMGASGSGKTTILQLMAGLDSMTNGEVFINGKPISTLSDNDMTKLRRGVGFIFQSYNLLPMFTAEQNITLPLTLSKTKLDKKWFDTLTGSLGLKDRLKHYPSQLSGGQQQRVAIARALITKPKIVFADEPTGNLDMVSGQGVMQYLRKAVSELGISVIMVTHDLSMVKYSDRTIFMADGKVFADNRGLTEQEASEIQKGIRSQILSA